jgi:DNA-binding NtrC family response regulator
MGFTQKQYQIAILDDSVFDKHLFTRYIKFFAQKVSQERNIRFTIRSYSSPYEFIHSISPNTDIAFIDYYLGKETSGLDILRSVKQRCPECNVVIMSRRRNFSTSVIPIREGAYRFLLKDKNIYQEGSKCIEELCNVA